MGILNYILIAIIVIGFILIWWVNTYNKFQEYIIRINEVEANIDSVIRKRFDLLNKSITIIKNNSKEDNVLEIIESLRNQKLSNFELDRNLNKALIEYHTYLEKYSNLKSNEEIIKINLSLTDSQAELEAFKKYYNDIITDYNKTIKVFPSLLVAKRHKYKVKSYFDGKNIDSDNIKL